ncbi:hypothetical protein [Zhongshania marina]|uniref:Bacteriophage tail tape measure N-terminal domain-containing protein n=1 Tax=Zhongshania marina TaxID=2304603 RepID=A0A2S4HGK5_9GAMM|nr:hypothetical protein [Marortus luteolus]POP53060.1 hypothetical protein C0068_08185 [Marortus luteolus]
MAKSYKTGIIITGDASGAVKASQLTGKELDALNRKGKQVSSQLSDIAAKSVKWGAVAAGAAAAGSAVLIQRQLELIDNTAKTSDKLGIATERLTALRVQAELTGVAQGTLDMALQRMVRRLAEAAEGTGEAKGALAELNLDAKELAKLSPDKQFAAIADALEGVESQGDKVRLAFKFFDSEGVALVNTLKGGSAAALEAQKFTEQWGLAISRVDAAKVEQANDALTMAAKAADGLWQQLTVRLSPAITQASLDVLGLGAEFGTAAELADAAVDTIVNGLDLIEKAAVLAGAVYVARLAGPVVQSQGAIAAAYVASTAARLKSNFAVYDGVQAEAINAAAANKTALAELAKADATLAASSAEVAGYKATLQSVKAELELEAVRLRSQISEQGRAASMQRMVAVRHELTAATVALARVEAEHASVLTAQTAASARATAATANYAAATAAATLSARALAGAQALLGGAMALVGGPVGVAVIAAAGLYMFREELGLVDTTASDVKRRISELAGEIGGLDRAATISNIGALEQSLASLESMAKQLQGELLRGTAKLENKGGILGYSASQLRGESEELKEIGASIALVSGQIDTFKQHLKDIDSEKDRQDQIFRERVAQEEKSISQKIRFLREENELLRLGYDLEDARFVVAYSHANDINKALMRQQREQKGIIDAYKEEASVLADLEEAQKRAAEAAADAAEESRKAMEKFLTASFGDNLAEGFNQGSKALASFIDGFSELLEVQEAYNAAQLDASATDAEKAKAATKYQSAQVGLYGDMAAASKQFFDEGSSGYEALQKAEQTFRLFEIAMAGKALAAKLFTVEASTAATVASVAPTVAAETTKGLAAGTAAAASSMVGVPWPANLAALAATVAALAGIGVLLSGGGGGSSYQKVSDSGIAASGSILGDAEENATSISNSLDTLSEIADSQLGYTAQMAQSLRNIEAGMVGLTAEFAALPSGARYEMTGGNSVGGILKGEINANVGSQQLDMQKFLSGYGGLALRLGATERAATELANNQDALSGLVLTSDLQRIINGMIETVEEGFGVIGRSAVGVRDAIVALDLPDLVIGANMSADEISEKLQDFFSNVGDGIIENVMPSIAVFQQGGETLLDTFSRVVGQVTVVKDLSSALGIALDNESLTSIGNNLSLAAGGFSELSTNVSDFLDFALTDAEQFERIGGSVAALFEGLNQSLPTSRDGVADLVRALDLTTDAGQKAFTTLTSASDLLDDYYSKLEDYTKSAYDFDTAFGLNDGRKELRDALAAVGHNLDVVETAAQGGVAALASLFAGLSDVQKAGLEPFTDAILDLVPAAAEAANAVDEVVDTTSLMIRLARAQGDETKALAMTREQELKAATAVERAILSQIYAAEDLAAATQSAVQAEQALASEREQIASQRYALETRLLQLQGDTVQLRNREIAAQDKSNRGLLSYIFALEDAKAADAAANAAASAANQAAADAARQSAAVIEGILTDRAALESRLYAIIDGSIEQRERETDAMDETNRSLRNQVEALEAQKAANDELVRSFEQLRSVSQSVSDYLLQLELGEFAGTPEQQAINALDQFRALAGAAMQGDVEAAQKLTSAADSAINLSSGAYASGVQFQSIYDEVKSTLAGFVSSVDVQSFEQQQLALMQQQIDAVNAVLASTEADTASQLEKLNALESTSIANSTANVDALGTLADYLQALGEALTVELTLTSTSEIEKLIKYVTDTDELPDDLKELALASASTFTKTLDYIAGTQLPTDLKNLALESFSTLLKTTNYVVGSTLPNDLKDLALASASSLTKTLHYISGTELPDDLMNLALESYSTLVKTTDYVVGSTLPNDLKALALAESSTLARNVVAQFASGTNFEAVDYALATNGAIQKTVRALKAAGYNQEAADIAFAASSTIQKAIQASGGSLTADQRALLNTLNGTSNVNVDADVLLRTDATMSDLLDAIVSQTQLTANYSQATYQRLSEIVTNTANIYDKLNSVTLGNQRVNVSANNTNPLYVTPSTVGSNALTVTSKNQSGSNLAKFASGGYVSGAGTSTSDSISAMLSNGEYVVKAAAVKSLGVGFLDNINSGSVPVAPVGMPRLANNNAEVVAELQTLRKDLNTLMAQQSADVNHQTRIGSAGSKQFVNELKILNAKVANLESEIKLARLEA